MAREGGEFIDYYAGIIFRDLTEDRYQATLDYLQVIPFDETLRLAFKGREEMIKRELEREIQNGLLRFVSHPSQLKIYPPAIMSIAGKPKIGSVEYACHAVVLTGTKQNPMVISNGKLMALDEEVSRWINPVNTCALHYITRV